MPVPIPAEKATTLEVGCRAVKRLGHGLVDPSSFVKKGF